MRWIAAGLMFTLGACSTPIIPIDGINPSSGETFTGQAAGWSEGIVQLQSSVGTACSGRFNVTGSRSGVGQVTCEDGRTGSFSFFDTGDGTTGTGTLDGEQINLVFREVPWPKRLDF